MDIAQMRMMLVLAECKSMTTTAKKLHVSQPSLTYQLKTIENDLGFKVFNRTRVGTSLTAEGAFMHNTIKQIVSDYDEAVRLARAMAKGSAAGTIRIGVNDSSRDTVSFLLNLAQATVAFSVIPCGNSDPVRLLREGIIDFWSTSDASVVNAPASLLFAPLSKARQQAFLPPGHRLAHKVALHIDDLAGETVWLWPQSTCSLAADSIRARLQELGSDVQDLVPGVPAIMTAFMDEGIVVYDEGFLPPPTHAAVQVPIIDAEPDVLGLVYQKSQHKRLSRIVNEITNHIPFERDRVVGASELAAQRIVLVLDEISSTVRRGGMKDIEPLVEYAINLGVSANHIINRGLLLGMNATSEAYQNNEIYTTEMMAAVATANIAMKALQPHLDLENEKPITGTAVIGTVLGDKHDIGKNLVRIMLESRDIEVTDLGTQVPPETFVEHVHNNANCNLVLISVNHTDFLENASAVVAALKKAKLREQVFVMVGGSAATQEFAGRIGADAYTANAADAADQACEFMSV